MKANELRILNKVSFNGKILTIKSIELNPVNLEYFIKVNENFSQIKIKALEPILLTEEILLKCGFNKDESERWCDMHEEYEECTYYYFDMFKLYYNPELGYYTDDTFEFKIKLEFLYQLQNLYFALTGEELTINL